MKNVDALMRQAVSENIFPGGRLLVSRAGKILFNEAYGLSNIFTRQEVTQHTVYDLASLTKPLATTLAVMILIQEGKLRLDQPLDETISAFRGTERAGIRIRHLLDHTSGLPDYRPYYIDIRELPFERRKDALREKLISEALVSVIGEQTLYSDIGFMILEWIIESASGKGLAEFAKEKIYDPIGIDNLFFVGRDRVIPDKKFAATEVCPWRRILLNGQVHDDNAFVMGGVAGHAGLFGTAESVHALLVELLNIYHEKPSGQLFQSDLVRVFFSKRNMQGRALGFDVPSPTGSSCGELFCRDATVGHLGFTGTSFWMDLKQNVIVILLTNRVHPSRSNEEIKKFRPLIHNRVMMELIKGSGI